MSTFDFIVIGAGIAGASVAAQLAARAQVLVLEMEERPGYHTTGRSAAAYEPNYGPQPVLALSRAGISFFKAPPQDFSELPIFSTRGSLVIEAQGQEQEAQSFLTESTGVQELGENEMIKLYPILRRGYARRGFLDLGTGDLDVGLLHAGYLKWLKRRGGKLACDAPARQIERKGGLWHIETAQGSFSAPNLVNAAGAWGDKVAEMAGVKPAGLVPKRRSIAVVPAPAEPDFMSWPFVVDCAESWYAKPQSGKLLVSSADATPVAPHDAYADDEAIATGIDRFMTATTHEVNRVEHSWGGLRSFVADKVPVVGFDPDAPGFFWLVGQGGYGIQTSDGLSRLAAALALHEPVPEDVLAQGFKLSDVLPERLRK